MGNRLLRHLRRWKGAVNSINYLVLATPPGTPNPNTKIIVAQNPTDEFEGHENEVARWNGSSYDFVAPVAGQRVPIRRSNGNTFGIIKYFPGYGLWLPDDTLSIGAAAWELEGPDQSIHTQSPGIEAIEFPSRLVVGCAEPGIQGVRLEVAGLMSTSVSCSVTGRETNDARYQLRIEKNGVVVAEDDQLIPRLETRHFMASYNGLIGIGDTVHYSVAVNYGVEGGSNEPIGMPRAMGWVEP